MYEEPTRLPDPFDLPPPNSFPLLALGLGAAIVLGGALFLASQLGYVLILYNALLGLALGWVIGLAVRLGRYPLGIQRHALAFSLVLYAVFNLALYAASIRGVAGERPNFFEFLVFRASQQVLLLGWNPGGWTNAAVWLAEIAATWGIASYLASKSVARVRLEAVPTPVTEYVLYLMFQGHGASEIQNQLATHGWTSSLDVVRALDAADVAISMIRPKSTAQTPSS